jgi:hypothetical protein
VFYFYLVCVRFGDVGRRRAVTCCSSSPAKARFQFDDTLTEAVRHERDISNAGRKKPDFTEINQCKPVLLGLSLAGNPVKPFLSLYGTKWRERGYGLSGKNGKVGKDDP